MRSGLFKPFYLLANIDIWASEPPRTLGDMSTWKYYSQYGRPHWSALKVAHGLGLADVMDLARCKLLAGRSHVPKKLSPIEGLAVLGVCLCVDVQPQSELSQDLVAGHMRLLLYASENRKYLMTGYCSEPVLVPLLPR